MQPYFYAIIFVIAYLFGSIPVSWLLVRSTQKKDIREEGSGNVGALNAWRSTQKKWLGVTALVLDVLKGAAPVFLFREYLNGDFLILLALVGGVLLGHCYPVWLRFHGGRGLAATAGALLLYQPVLVGLWLGTWLVYYILIRKHIIANLIATFLLPIVVFFTPGWLFGDETLLMLLPICLLIIMRHLVRIPDLLSRPLDAA